MRVRRRQPHHLTGPPDARPGHRGPGRMAPDAGRHSGAPAGLPRAANTAAMTAGVRPRQHARRGRAAARMPPSPHQRNQPHICRSHQDGKPLSPHPGTPADRRSCPSHRCRHLRWVQAPRNQARTRTLDRAEGAIAKTTPGDRRAAQRGLQPSGRARLSQRSPQCQSCRPARRQLMSNSLPSGSFIPTA